MFLGEDEWCRLVRDLDLLREALLSLPARLFSGDLAAFARAAGMNEYQTRCIMRTSVPEPTRVTRMTRADLFRDASGFRLLEWNFGSTVGGAGNADMCRALLASHPGLRRFVDDEDLRFTDTLVEQIATIRSETGFPEGTRPVVAIAEWPGSFADMEPVLRQFAENWLPFEFDSVVCHVGDFDHREGRLWLGDRPIDIVYRVFLIADVAEEDAEVLLEPLLSAVECGAVRLFTPLDAELFGSKGALALLSEPGGQVGLTSEEQDACGRLLPWTRIVRPGPVVLGDGSSGDLLEYAVAHRSELVLKPAALHGGKGVVMGWHPDLTPEEWCTHLAEAVNSPYVLQEMIEPILEVFPTGEGVALEPWCVSWGIYTMVNGYAGILIRGVPGEGLPKVINIGNGAHIGCGFHVGFAEG
jgi:hypothetical protein